MHIRPPLLSLVTLLSACAGDLTSPDNAFTFQPGQEGPGIGSAAAALLAMPMPVVNGASIDVTGGACALAHGASGSVHLAFTSSTHPSVSYGEWNGATWTLELVDGFGFNTGGLVMSNHVSMAIDATGAPHLAYLMGDRSVWYARRSGGSWIRENVAPALEVNASRGPALTLHPSTGQPTIAFTIVTGNLNRIAVASRMGVNSWTVAQPLFGAFDTIYEETLLGEILFDGGGTLYLPTSLSGYVNGSYRYGSFLASWTPSTRAILELTQDFPGKTALAWAGPARLVGRFQRGVVDFGLTSPLASSTATYSANETNAPGTGDLVWSGGLPVELHQHGGALELVTPDAQGFWTYTQLGDSSGMSSGLSRNPVTGELNICYQLNNRVMFQ